jgi:(R,R)-butanediol dehydrogenase/meso-butanediol dehydrogenase/diacetyl reductase
VSGEATPGVVLGHEFSGEVARVGPDVHQLTPGMRIAGGGGTHAALPGTARPPNPAAPWDRRFSPRMNGRLGSPGTVEQGGFAGYKLMWEREAVPLAPGLDNRAAAIAEPTAVAVHAVRRSGLGLGETAVVIGLGPIGLLVGQCAHAAGAARVIGIDPSARRRAAARRMGFETALDPRQERDIARAVVEMFEGLGPDVVYECAGAPATLEQALQMARPQGKVLYVALCWTPATVHPVDWVGREVTLVTAYLYGAYGWQTALALLEQGAIAVDEIIPQESTFRLTDIQSAFERCIEPEGIVKPLLLPEQDATAAPAER